MSYQRIIQKKVYVDVFKANFYYSNNTILYLFSYYDILYVNNIVVSELLCQEIISYEQLREHCVSELVYSLTLNTRHAV